MILVGSGSQLIGCLFPRNDQFELVCMSEHNSIQVFDFFFFSDLETVDEYFGFGFGSDVELFALLSDGTMTLVDTQGVDFDIVFFDFIGTDGGFALFQLV